MIDHLFCTSVIPVPYLLFVDSSKKDICIKFCTAIVNTVLESYSAYTLYKATLRTEKSEWLQIQIDKDPTKWPSLVWFIGL